MNTRKMASGILMATVALFLGACGLPTPIEPPTLTPTKVIMADCWHSIRVAAWQDLDGDGLWGASELPLEGVKFDMQGPIAEMSGDPLVSKADGHLDIELWHPGQCYYETYTIVADPPDSYEPTTLASVTFSLNSDETVYEVQFGFRAVSK